MEPSHGVTSLDFLDFGTYRGAAISMVELFGSSHFVHILLNVEFVSGPPPPMPPSSGDDKVLLLFLLVCMNNKIFI